MSIKQLLKHNIIKHSNSPDSAPVTLVNKKDEGEKSRLCIDFRKFNKISIVDSYPFPRIEDILDGFHGSTVFSTMDISSGFWHIKVREKDTHKLGFVTQRNHFEFSRSAFGFRHSSAIFGRILSRIIEKYNLQDFCHNFIDDILVHSKNNEEHQIHLRALFSALRSEMIKLKLSKCKFAQETVEYLGHRIHFNEIRPLNDNVSAIENFPTSECRKSLQRLLGKINYYRKFVPNITKILYPLFNLLKQDIEFKWDEDCENAFIKVKKILTSHPVLMIFDPSKKCIIQTDASKIGIGAVLKQEACDGKLDPVAYFSRKLLPYEMNYSISELKCLAVVDSLGYWLHYIYGKKFVVFTDHIALQWLNKIKKPRSRLFKWSLKLSQYDFEINYRPGAQNVEADSLSRSPVRVDFHHNDHLRIVNLITKNEIKKGQIEEKTEGIPLPYRLNNEGLLVKKKGLFSKYYVPLDLRAKIIDEFHHEFGHFGVKKCSK